MIVTASNTPLWPSNSPWSKVMLTLGSSAWDRNFPSLEKLLPDTITTIKAIYLQCRFLIILTLCVLSRPLHLYASQKLSIKDYRYRSPEGPLTIFVLYFLIFGLQFYLPIWFLFLNFFFFTFYFKLKYSFFYIFLFPTFRLLLFCFFSFDFFLVFHIFVFCFLLFCFDFVLFFNFCFCFLLFCSSFHFFLLFNFVVFYFCFCFSRVSD